MKFDDQDSETVSITSSPFWDYVSNFRLATEKEPATSTTSPEKETAALDPLCSPIRYKKDAKFGDDLTFDEGQFCFNKILDVSSSMMIDQAFFSAVFNNMIRTPLGLPNRSHPKLKTKRKHMKAHRRRRH